MNAYSFISADAAQVRNTSKGIQYDLLIRQQPDRARVCTFKEKERRPVDPPPIIQLKVREPYDAASNYLQNPYFFMCADLVPSAARDPERTTAVNRTLAGTVVSSLHRLKDVDNSDGGFFVFGDLSVKLEGEYRLKFTLFELVKNEVIHLQSCISKPFIVYAAKSFPGMSESTFLSRSFADQGVRIRIRKEHRMQMKRNASGKPVDETGGARSVSPPVLAVSPLHSHRLIKTPFPLRKRRAENMEEQPPQTAPPVEREPHHHRQQEPQNQQQQQQQQQQHYHPYQHQQVPPTTIHEQPQRQYPQQYYPQQHIHHSQPPIHAPREMEPSYSSQGQFVQNRPGQGYEQQHPQYENPSMRGPPGQMARGRLSSGYGGFDAQTKRPRLGSTLLTPVSATSTEAPPFSPTYAPAHHPQGQQQQQQPRPHPYPPAAVVQRHGYGPQQSGYANERPAQHRHPSINAGQPPGAPTWRLPGFRRRTSWQLSAAAMTTTVESPMPSPVSPRTQYASPFPPPPQAQSHPQLSRPMMQHSYSQESYLPPSQHRQQAWEARMSRPPSNEAIAPFPAQKSGPHNPHSIGPLPGAAAVPPASNMQFSRTEGGRLSHESSDIGEPVVKGAISPPPAVLQPPHDPMRPSTSSSGTPSGPTEPDDFRIKLPPLQLPPLRVGVPGDGTPPPASMFGR
ncbi:hypothetical protein YB2330_001579 [Saitoella coloradoensis]